MKMEHVNALKEHMKTKIINVFHVNQLALNALVLLNVKYVKTEILN